MPARSPTPSSNYGRYFYNDRPSIRDATTPKGGRLFAYPMNVAQDGRGFLGDLPDWPQCDPVGLTREAVHDEAIRSISAMAIARMRDGEPLPFRGSAPAGWENEVLVKLPWTLRVDVLTYEATRRARELVSRGST